MKPVKANGGKWKTLHSKQKTSPVYQVVNKVLSSVDEKFIFFTVQTFKGYQGF